MSDTVLIRFDKQLLDEFFTRDADGNRLSLTLGEEDPEGVRVAILTRHHDDNPLAEATARLEDLEDTEGLRPLVRGFAKIMEHRLREFDGKKGVARDWDARRFSEFFAERMTDNALRARHLVMDPAMTSCTHDYALLQSLVADTANIAALLHATTEYCSAAYLDETCEFGCAQAVVTHDINGLPMCLPCVLETLLEPQSDRGTNPPLDGVVYDARPGDAL